MIFVNRAFLDLLVAGDDDIDDGADHHERGGSEHFNGHGDVSEGSRIIVRQHHER